MSDNPNAEHLDPPSTAQPAPGENGSSEHLRQLRLQASARERFLAEVPLLSDEEVRQLVGSEASLLKREGRLFSVDCGGAEVYPAFQFADGHPRPEIAEVLDAFASEEAWTVALWFNAPSGWLSGHRPLALFEDEAARVVVAARKTASPMEF